jgi:hypothetical protein
MNRTRDHDKAVDVIERLLIATEAMIVGSGPLKTRLLRAFEPMSALQEQDFPLSAQRLFRDFFGLMTVRSPPPHLSQFGSAEWTVRTMSGPAARKAALAFNRLHEELIRVLSGSSASILR